MLDSVLTRALKDLAQREGAALFMTLLAGFQTLLYRYSGQEDVVVGVPSGGRPHPALEGLIGFFVNTLVLRTDLSGNPPFRKLLGRVKETALEAYAHQDLPFERLVEEMQPQRSLGHKPLIQVVFAFQDASLSPLQLGSATVTPLPVETGTAKFDLTFSVSREHDSVHCCMEYNTDLFNKETVQSLLGHWHILLDCIVANPDQRLHDLPLLTAAERQQVLVDWNRTETDYPSAACIHTLFKAQAKSRPDAVALVSGGQRLSYGALNIRANRLAHHLCQLGVGPGSQVAICMERSQEMVVGLLGILKAGAAYVPLDPIYPAERLAFMLADCQASLLLTTTGLGASLPPHHAKVVCIDTAEETITRQSADNPSTGVSADSPAYICYTSGSTGTPKGAVVLHRGVIRLLFGVDYVQLDHAQTTLHLSTISFDASTFELWGALLHGGRCVLFPARIPTVRELGQILDENQVTVLWLTAALFNTVVDEAPEVLKGIGQLLVGGEALSVPHVRRALQLLPSTQLINGYGPTEGTTFTCCKSIPRQLDEQLASIPIGRPISNTQVYVLDNSLQPVPVGLPGELYIGGAASPAAI